VETKDRSEVAGMEETVYRVVPGGRNWQVETADWSLDVRLDI